MSAEWRALTACFDVDTSATCNRPRKTSSRSRAAADSTSQWLVVLVSAGMSAVQLTAARPAVSTPTRTRRFGIFSAYGSVAFSQAYPRENADRKTGTQSSLDFSCASRANLALRVLVRPSKTRITAFFRDGGGARTLLRTAGLMGKSAFLILVGILLVACGGSSASVPTSSGSGGPGDGGSSTKSEAGAKADAGAPDEGTWSIAGTIRGIDVQDDARAAIARRIDDGTSIRTSVTLTNFDGYCAKAQGNASCPGEGSTQRLMVITIPGTKAGAYSIASGDPLRPPAGKAGVAFIALNEACEALAPQLEATSGSVTFTEIDLANGGKASLSFDVSTEEGAVSGTITAPSCE
jgi:hypothetical protein